MRGWDLGNGPALFEVPINGRQPGALSSMAFAPNGELLLSVEINGRIRLWNVAQRKLVATLEERTAGPVCVAFAPDSKRLVSACVNGVKLWDAATGRLIQRVEKKPADYLAAGFSPT